MSLFNGMKDKLGFGSKPEWQDDDYTDDANGDYGYDDGGYADDGYSEGGYDDSGSGSGSGSVVSFDAYNPHNFDNVKISSENEPRVASYDDLGKSRYSSRSSSSYGSSRSGLRPCARSVHGVRPAGPTAATPGLRAPRVRVAPGRRATPRSSTSRRPRAAAAT